MCYTVGPCLKNEQIKTNMETSKDAKGTRRKMNNFLRAPWQPNRESRSPNLDTLLHPSKQDTSSGLDLDSAEVTNYLEDSGHW